MQKRLLVLMWVWISIAVLSGCVSSKATIFGEDMPSMKTIHDKKFSHSANDALIKPDRQISEDTSQDNQADFQWLPNPTLTMYVFKHLSPTGYPVPGYSTFFRLYQRDHVAEPSEQGGWE